MADFKRDEIILLLGAGASIEADIPDSNKMVREIEDAVSNDVNWNCFRNLYRYIRSSVFYADGLDGVFGDAVLFNIERLVDVLDELRKKERHVLYPFVGAWNPKLLDVAGAEFEHVHQLRNEIITKLRNKWIPLQQREKANYYEGLLRFQQEYGYPLRVFTLNYDLCVEEICGRTNVQRGFSDRMWDWRLFNETDDPVPLLLYKLHGSIDWHFNHDNRVTYSDSTSDIPNDDIALIFGTSYKLQYVDPFLFLVYELRRWTLDVARVIVCIGYGFNDDHINGILRQSLQQDQQRKLLAVIGPSTDDIIIEKRQQYIVNIMNANKCQVEIQACGAKEFLGSNLAINSLSTLFPSEINLFPKL